GVVAKAVGDRLDHAGPLAGTGAGDGVAHGLAYGDDVVAVDLDGRQPRGDALLGQGLGAGLDLARYRNGPLVVDDHRHHPQPARVGVMGSPRALRTARMSLPSAWVVGSPAALPFWARVSAPDWISRGTEMAHWLLTITATIGSWRAPARLMAPMKSPLEEPPS